MHPPKCTYLSGITANEGGEPVTDCSAGERAAWPPEMPAGDTGADEPVADAGVTTETAWPWALGRGVSLRVYLVNG
jgi:hypothetical protein